MRCTNILSVVIAGVARLTAADSSVITPGSSATTSLGTTPTSTATCNPCAKISAHWAEHNRQNKTTHPTVKASLAHECLKSVPLGQHEAVQLIDAIEPYLEWQSDAAYKKDPPESYFYPGFDIFGNLAKVRSNVQAGKYSNEFDFQTDLYKQVWAPGHDGHFYFNPDLLHRAFRWYRNVSIVSISENGEALPTIKLQTDVLANPKTAQAITKINGINATKYVEDTANAASHFHDADASYNSMFWSKPTAAKGNVGDFVGAYSFLFYPGDTTNLTYANGTTIEVENMAFIDGNMTGVVDGPSMYKRFCSPLPLQPAAASANTNTTINTITNATIPGYPTPVIISPDRTISGYYLSGPGLDNVAVIYLQLFPGSNFAEFQTAISDFLRKAKAAGKTRLIIDLQGNRGGVVLLAYDFFRQLFPSIVQDGISRWKLSKTFEHLPRVVSELIKDIDPATETNLELRSLYYTPWSYRHNLNISNHNFEKFEEKYSPHTYKNTNYSNLIRINVGDPLTTTKLLGIDISGYGTRTNLTQPFEAENIILLHDGLCESSCSTVSTLLRHQGGVKSIAMGGRPNQGPMQGVGGVKGAQGLVFNDIYQYINSVSRFTTNSTVKSELQRFKTLPMERSVAAGINAQDQILRDNINNGIPSQYITEEADCRLYWTAPMISDVTEIWKSAANSAFNGAKCAYGGISTSKAKRGNKAPPVHGLN
ncbi:pyridine nucleotide-disulfide oxidoreductase family protein [Metarhizium brunneum]